MATLSLATSNVLVYLALGILGNNMLEIDDSLVVFFGQYNLLVLRYGAFWQLFTAIFVHFNVLHLLLNVFFLLLVGNRLEKIIGSRKFLLLYLLCGFFGNLLTLALGPDLLSAGSSGAVLGICSAFYVIANKLSQRPVTNALPQIAVLFLLNSIIPGVNVLAHLGGIVAGAVIGYFEARRFPKVIWRYDATTV
jgi:rhomboid protease GluP